MAHLIPELARHAHERGLVLFLGAGVNGAELPQWEDLLKRLLTRAVEQLMDRDKALENDKMRESILEWIKKEHDVYARASLAKALLGGEYLNSLRQSLYEFPEKALDLDKFRKHFQALPLLQAEGSCFPFLSAIVELCQLPEVRAVATFNFDNLLETAMVLYAGEDKGKRQPQSIAGKADLSPPHVRRGSVASLPVYHLHGLLEVDPGIFDGANPRVVFSRDEYLLAASQSLDWETTTPIHLLNNYCSLWLGASLTDWNMLRLVQAASQKHRELSCFCLESEASLHLDDKEAIKVDKVEMVRLAGRFRRTILEDAGVDVISSGTDYTTLPAKLREIAQAIKAQRPAQEKPET
jgi:hypothetical protein